MTDYYSMVDVQGAKKQIEALKSLNLAVDPALERIANAEFATQGAEVNGATNSTPYPLKKVMDVYFSTDIEADGPIPGPYSMSSIGMVACATLSKDGTFNRLDMDLDAHTFYAELKPISENFVEEKAAVAARTGLTREYLTAHGLEATDAMNQAFEKITTVTQAYGGYARPVFVGYPLGFDWLFTYWYLMNFADKGSPFGHSSHLDIKTLYATKASVPIKGIGKRSIPKELMSKRKHTHKAIDDAREQGDLFCNIMEWKD